MSNLLKRKKLYQMRMLAERLMRKHSRPCGYFSFVVVKKPSLRKIKNTWLPTLKLGHAQMGV